MSPLQAGAAFTDISPKDSQFLFGYPHVPRHSTGIHDPLFSTALYLADGLNRIMFISNDVIFVSKEICRKVRERIEASLDIPPSNIMITATHTHSGPITVNYLSNDRDEVVPEADPKYLAFFEDCMVDSALKAYNRAEPAQIGLAVADGTGVGTNRRNILGPADPQVPVMMVQSLKKRENIACMMTYSMHPTVLHEDSTLVSADFPGMTRMHLQKILGKVCPVLYHTGPEGNQSTRHVVRGNTFNEALRLGEMLGRAAAKVIPGINYSSEIALKAAVRFVDLPRKEFLPVDEAEIRLKRAREKLERLKASGSPREEIRTAECDWFGAEETLTLALASENRRVEDYYASCLPAEIQILSIGPWYFVGWPGEVFVEYALTVKENTDNVFIINLANGELQGYIVTEAAAREGGYEASNGLFKPESGKILVDTTLEMIDGRFQYLEKFAKGMVLSLEEKEALTFLYAYMPLHDLCCHDGEFYLQNVRSSLKARKAMPWGENIPDDIFMRFVLFCRVNNENMDSSRMIFYDELKVRVRNLSMKDAALEINHWCHEKATYKPTDIRTESPLGVIKTAFGRCGEESTLAVAALRSVCIPARQCYSPRWAHCDDNHAWVEAWIDGTWHFIGACEPAPVLDMAWFRGPVRRAMMVHTKVPGDYSSVDEVILKNGWHTEINLLPRYAKVKKIKVLVLDKQSRPVSNAVVEYMVYNSAHFFPISTQKTSDKGKTSLTTGLGDLLIYAHKHKHFGYKKISVKNIDTIDTIDTVEIVLNRDGADEYTETLDMVPPPEEFLEPLKISRIDKEKNALRLKQEDRIRKGYESTFIEKAEVDELANETGFDADRLWKLVETSRGNWNVIMDYIRTEYKKYGELCLDLLETLAEKDLRDIEPVVLNDHLTNSLYYKNAEEFCSYILTPRIKNELLVPYKGFFQSRFSSEETEKFKQDPAEIAGWIENNIETLTEIDGYRNPVTPIGVYELKKTDSISKDIFFVALCRSFGIPSRLEPAVQNPQFLINKKWIDVDFSNPDKFIKEKKTGYIELVKKAADIGLKSEYFHNFTISKLIQGAYCVLDYRDTGFDVFTHSFPLKEGSYLLVTGNRLSDGTVLSKLTFFTVETGKTKKIAFEIRTDEKIVSLGKISDKLSKGNITAWIEPDTEPTRHFIRDLERLKESFDRSGVNIVVYSENGEREDLFAAGSEKKLPESIDIIKDEGYLLLEDFRKGLNEPYAASFPVVSVIDNEGRIVYLSSGYKIGLGEQLIKTLHKIKEV